MMSNSHSIGIIACAEAGPLEQQITLLVKSLRKWGGVLSQASFYVFSPRPDHLIGKSTQRELGELGANFIDLPLNQKYGDYPVDNKIFACAWAEANLPHDTIAFVDSDTVFVNEPKSLVRDAPGVALRPVDRRGAGSTGKHYKNDIYWQRAYGYCGVETRRMVNTTVDNEPIREYWNAGLVGASRNLGFFSLWQDMYLRLVKHNHRPSQWPRQLDQIALAMATGTLPDEQIHTLPQGYNYPLPMRPWLPEGARSLAWKDLVHLHYHRWFNTQQFLQRLTPRLDTGNPRFHWLDSALPLMPVSEEIYRRDCDNKRYQA